MAFMGCEDVQDAQAITVSRLRTLPDMDAKEAPDSGVGQETPPAYPDD